ncbi:helix-turn-helix transcriptional regulator [Crossiella sp. CA-258035]|uniref:helix-turn-helix transcriptional regulator n=1 Tax=Crossiella sp. CA-258035 TaxID=2981138 RepID=UPI0024BC15B8|nr:helix-turn-helix transcriptional regulator [Crossiella sp. CA-258035]WHT15909.1 helix-turn-helix transcriptional regulator [Crossiella sp. CA-258035]
MDRNQLADFLRRCRARLQPAEVGGLDLARRRTPGLRREEVARLACIATDTYARLEQGRGRHPTTQVLAALARALRLTDDERDHLYLLAGHEPPAPPRTTELRPSMIPLLYRLWDYPAMVISDLGVCLAQNPLARALMGDLAAAHGWDRSFHWRWFARPESRALFPAEDHAEHSRVQVADLRATAARRAGDQDVREFVRALRSASAEFAELWDQHEVAVRRSDHKRFLHPEMGLIETRCEILLTPEHDQRLLFYAAEVGTVSHDRLQLLGMLAYQTPEDQAEAEAALAEMEAMDRYPQEPFQS